jgi:hypothetical protein
MEEPFMRFLTLVKSADTGGVPPPGLMNAIGALAEEAGPALVQMGGLLPTSQGRRYSIRRGELIVTDGPFAETKEVIGGYAIIEVSSVGEARAWTEKFMRLHLEHWPEWEGETELRQIFSADDVAAEVV